MDKETSKQLQRLRIEVLKIANKLNNNGLYEVGQAIGCIAVEAQDLAIFALRDSIDNLNVQLEKEGQQGV